MLNSIDVAPVWVEINLDNLEHNAKEILRVVDEDTLITGVIKANAYGHGAVMVGKVLLECGFDKLAVANVREAIELRKSGIKADILILGFTQKSDLNKVFDYGLTQTIYRLDQARALSEIGQMRDEEIKVHIKIDTGLSRLGFLNTKDSIDDIMKIMELKYINIEGMFTHLATADSKDKTFSREQVEDYLDVVDKLEKRGADVGYKHVSNSAVVMDLPEYNFDMVKPGIIQYGLYPSDEVNKNAMDLKPIMELKTKISNLKELEADVGISYGQTYRTKEKSLIATIPVGYGDGLSRLLSNLGEVGIAGKRAKILGNVCMDQTMIDVTGITDVEIEDQVVLISNGDDNYPRIEEVASNIGTINYEVATLVGRRIPRVYLKNGEVINIVDYLFD